MTDPNIAIEAQSENIAKREELIEKQSAKSKILDPYTYQDFLQSTANRNKWRTQLSAL